MLSGSTVVSLVNAIVPLYLCIALGYASSKLRILPHKQTYAGIGGFNSRFSIPFLVFRIVATNNPYAMNLNFIGADTLCKVSILLVLFLVCFCRPSHQNIAWASTLYNLTSIPNSILIGTPLLTALYPGTAQDIATLVFMQCLVWFNVCILLLETHKAVYEMSEDYEAERSRQLDLHELQGGKLSLGANGSGEGATQTKQDNISNIIPDRLRAAMTVKDLLVAVAHIPRGATDDLAIQIPAAEVECQKTKVDLAIQIPAAEVECQKTKVDLAIQISAAEVECQKTEFCAEEGAVKVKLTRRQVGKKIAKAVLYKFFWAPIVWASMLGFVYALINFKYNNGKPLPASLKSFIDLLANCTLGICMFLLGMNMGVAPKLLACGLPKALFGAGVRFIVSPAIMAVASFAVGLRGNMFRFAVLQAMVPQSVLSFVFASQYNVHLDLFSTAVWFQIAIFLPFAVALDLLLSVGS